MKYLFYGDELFFYLLKETLPLKIERKENFEDGNYEEDILITDNNIFSKNNINISIFNKIIIFSDRIDTEFFIKYKILKNKLEFHKRDEYIYLENFIGGNSNFSFLPQNKIILSDSFKELITPIKNIEYFSYDRNLKKSFAVVMGKAYFLRKSLTEIEKIVENSSFIRVERSIILNIEQIKEIDYKEEYILTKSDQKIYLGKQILKKISENYFSSFFRL